MGGDQDAPDRLHGGDAEGDLADRADGAQLLEDLGGVAVPGGGEAVHGAAAVGVVRRGGRLRARCRGADQGVDHDRHGRVDQAGPDEGCQGEDAGRRHTATDGQPVSGRDLLAVKLRQPVHEAGEQLRAGVLPPVPAGVVGGVVEPEVGGEVDDDRGQGQGAVDARCGLAVTQRREDDVRGLQVVEAAETELVPVAELRMDGGDRLAAQALGRDLGHLEVRVAGEQPQQLTTGVARSALDDGSHRLSSSRAPPRTATARSSSATSTASSGVWSRWESPGP